MLNAKYGDKVTWTEGSQMDKMTHRGIVVKVKTIVTVAEKNGETSDVEIEDLKRGWAVKDV